MGDVPSSETVGARSQTVNFNDNIPQTNGIVNNNMPFKVVLSPNIPMHLVDSVNAIKKKTGIDVVFGTAYNADGSINTKYRGEYGDNRIVVSENATKASVYRAVVMHELTHSIEGTKLYNDIKNYVINKKYGGNQEQLNRDIANKIEQYKKNNKPLDRAEAEAEIIADNVEHYIFADDVRSIVEQDYTFGQKMYDFISELIYKLKKKYNFSVDELASAQRKYRMALDEVKRNGVISPHKAYAMENKVYDYTKSFAEQVDDWKAGKIPQYDTLLIGKTPDVFKNIGVNSIPFTINQEHVDYAVNGTKDVDHYIGEDMLKQLPQALENPVAIFQDTRNANIDNRLIALLKLTHNGKQVITPVAIDGFGRLNNKRIDSNAVVSMFAKDKSVESMLDDALLAENYGNKSMFYWNKKEALSLLQRAGVQYPSGLPQDGFIHSIRENDAFVNYRLEDVTHSKQFKDWFGDWLKNPKKASKVVNEDGTPMVVYHGTRSKFTKFNKWSYFTEDKNYADLYARETHGRPNGEVMAVYINSRKPFDIRNKEIMDIYEKEFIPTQKLDNDLLVTDIGLPHAVVADDLIRFIEEKGYDYDSIVLDEAGVDDGPGYKRVSYVVKEPTQIKSATDNIGTFDPNNLDIRYSFVTEEDTETGKFTDESGNEYTRVDDIDDSFGVRILEGKDESGKDILKIDIDNPDLDNVVNSEEYKRLIEFAYDIKEVKGVTLTAERAFEKAFGKNYEDFRKVIYDNLDKSKLQYMNVLDYLTKGFQENVIKRGIKKGSKDSELLQKQGC